MKTMLLWKQGLFKGYQLKTVARYANTTNNDGGLIEQFLLL